MAFSAIRIRDWWHFLPSKCENAITKCHQLWFVVERNCNIATLQSIRFCGLEHCKVAKYIDIALLRSCRKDWWIEMKNVQISQELFFLLVRYFLIGQEETEPEIAKALEKKMDALVMRELYTQYKTAPTEEEKEKARREYLDRRGVPDSFRW